MYHVVVQAAPEEIIGRMKAMRHWIVQHHYELPELSSRGATIDAEFRIRTQADSFAKAFSGRLMCD